VLASLFIKGLSEVVLDYLGQGRQAGYFLEILDTQGVESKKKIYLILA
jgi:hypothetical protein